MTATPSIDVLLEDGPCLVVNKSAGVLTEGPPAAEDTLVRRVKEHLKQRDGKPGNVYLGIPHRLDRAVSGAIVFAKNSKAARRLAEQFRDRQVLKIYWALVEAGPADDEGALRHWLVKAPDRPAASLVEVGTDGAKQAALHYRVLARRSTGCLLEVTLETGRFHQIRVQLAHIGCPVLGDALYGASLPFETGIPPRPHSEPPIALHARRLSFLHPIRYDRVEVEAPPPEYWQPYLE